MATLRNDRSGETLQSSLTNSEAVAAFAAAAPENHWLWFWLHKFSADRPRQQNQAGALRYLQDSFLLAIGYAAVRHQAAANGKGKGKKVEMPRSPMIRVHFGERRFKFYLSRRGTVCLKSGGLSAPAKNGCRKPVGDEEYVGCLVGGRFSPARLGYGDDRNRPLRTMLADETEFLRRLEADPVGFLAECSKDMGRCCYCYAPLEDARSKDVGYGPVCAVNWGLPWGDKDRKEKVPSFSQQYDADAAGLLWEIRQAPEDETTWAVFADWLEGHGLPRCGCPVKGTPLPRNDGEGKPAPVPGVHSPLSNGNGHATLVSKPTDVPPPAPVPTLSADDTVPWERAPGADVWDRCRRQTPAPPVTVDGAKLICSASRKTLSGWPEALGVKGCPPVVAVRGKTDAVKLFSGPKAGPDGESIYTSLDGWTLTLLNDPV